MTATEKGTGGLRLAADADARAARLRRGARKKGLRAVSRPRRGWFVCCGDDPTLMLEDAACLSIAQAEAVVGAFDPEVGTRVLMGRYEFFTFAEDDPAERRAAEVAEATLDPLVGPWAIVEFDEPWRPAA